MNAQQVGNYEIIRMLARGGMAVVYLVRQPALDREVVLKRLDLDSDDPTLAQRFVGEARLAATLDHPNIVTLFDFFEDDGVPYIAMEYVAGGSLRTLTGRLQLPQLFGLAEGILAGLDHAEQREIAHRDLKPENVLLTRRGGVKIADFGIARAYNSLTHRLTTSGMAIGTPAYMAPEQALNEPIGPYTDLYALGVIVYELLAGRPPFDSGTPLGVLYRQVHQAPPPLKDLLPNPQPALCEWIEWLLSKKPAARPQSALEAWDALEEIAVAELGPYWRRTAAIAPDGLATGVLPEEVAEAEPTTTLESATVTVAPEPTAKRPTPTTAAPKAPLRRSRRRTALAAAGVAVAAVTGTVAYTALSPGDHPSGGASEVTPTPTPTPKTAGVLPYDFDGDGRQELVAAFLRAAPRGRSTPSGVVLIHRGRLSQPAWRHITEADAQVGGRPRPDDAFGSGLASADFNGDGKADLAIGTPGKERVSVLYGGGARMLDGRRVQFPGRKMGLPDGAGEYGFLLLAADLNRDGYADLVVSAPGPRLGRARRGAMQILFGSKDGLARDGARVLRRPGADMAGFGLRMRSGDIDHDGNIDLVEGAPAGQGGAPGHASYCPGTARGPVRCHTLGVNSATSSLAVGDVDHDHYDDIVQGDDAQPGPGGGLPPTAGSVRLWRGGPHGPRPKPITITQNSPGIPGTDEPGDRFGAVVEAADMDGDHFADMIVGAIGEDDGAGRVAVIRGGPKGYTRLAPSSFDQSWAVVPGKPAPNRQFGSALTALNLTADHRLDLAVAVREEQTVNDRVMVVEGGPGLLAPSETHTRTLSGAAQHVNARRGGRIRLATSAGG